MTEVYFDNAATTKTFPQVREIMMQVLGEEYGNPSSMHMRGFHAEEYVKQAREIIADSMKVTPREITFTSGGTEGNNLALIGTAMANRRQRRHIISTVIEHPSVGNTLSFLEKEGFRITRLPVDEDGLVSPESVTEAMCEDTFLVSVMCINNEIGSVQRTEEIGRAVKAKDPKVLFHSDCVQAYGKIPILPKRWKADLVTISGHKIHGPKGIGAIYIKEGTKLRPILYGGNQEKGIRSGTENVPGIAGFGKAAQIMVSGMEENAAKIREIKERFEKRVLEEIENVRCNSGQAAHISSISFPGVRSEVLLHALEERGIYVSAGSACASNKPEVSATLRGIGLSREYYESTLRFSFSVMNEPEEADLCVDALREIVPMLRRFQRR